MNSSRRYLILNKKIYETLTEYPLNGGPELFYLEPTSSGARVSSKNNSYHEEFKFQGNLLNPLIKENNLAKVFKTLIKSLGPFSAIISDLTNEFNFILFFAKAHGENQILVEAQDKNDLVTGPIGACADLLFCKKVEFCDTLNNRSVFTFHKQSVVSYLQQHSISRFENNFKIPTNKKKAETKNILFIAYYMPPVSTVGAIRPNYWHEHINKITNGNFNSITITAIN